MKKQFCPETVQLLIGRHQEDLDEQAQRVIPLERTPLHVEFSKTSNRVAAEPLSRDELSDPARFNAIGSLQDFGARLHHPVLDVDGGVTTQRNGRKAILGAIYPGSYSAVSQLRDVLGDNQIDLEVFMHPKFEYNLTGAYDSYVGMQTGSIVLRSVEPIFEAVDSTTEGHGHLFIQKSFYPGDHRELIRELGSVGVISPDWQKMVQKAGMGIVRTPWTEKAITHKPS